MIRYFAQKKRPGSPVVVTEALLQEFDTQQARVCPLQCPPGQAANGDTCMATASTTPEAPKAGEAPKAKVLARPAPPPPVRQEVRRPAPAPRYEAARPASPPVRVGNFGGGGGGHATAIGVGF
jgi:hypothetical protein